MPTRITDSSATLVDHIYYSEGSNSKRDVNIKSGNLWCDLTDHLPNYTLIVNKYSKTKSMPRFIRIFSDCNIDKFKKVISVIDWQQLYVLDNVNSAYQLFIDLITRCYHTCFPLTKLSRKRSKDKIWLTPGLKLSIKHNKLYKKWINSKTKTDELNYKNYRKLFKQIAAEAEQTYFKQLFDTRTNNTKQLWNNLDRVCSFSKKKDKTSISELFVNNQKITDSKDICDCFNNYFCTVGEKLSSNLAHLTTNYDNFYNYLPMAPKQSMFCTPITTFEIEKIISSLKSNKSPGPDNIGPKIIKAIGELIAEPLSFIYNMSFVNGTVPYQLKILKLFQCLKRVIETLLVITGPFHC